MYVIISNLYIKEVSVILEEDDMCLVRFTDSDAGMRIRSNRLYPTKAAAMEDLPKKDVKRSERERMGPWAWVH